MQGKCCRQCSVQRHKKARQRFVDEREENRDRARQLITALCVLSRESEVPEEDAAGMPEARHERAKR